MNPQAAGDIPTNELQVIDVGPFSIFYSMFNDFSRTAYVPNLSHESEQRLQILREIATTSEPSAVVAIGGFNRQEHNRIVIVNDDNNDNVMERRDVDNDEDEDEDLLFEDLPDLFDRNSGNIIEYRSNPQGGELTDSVVGTPRTW